MLPFYGNTGQKNSWTVAHYILFLSSSLELSSFNHCLGRRLIFPTIWHVQILPEWHELRIRFGNDYVHNCQRVGRWFGRSRHA